MALSWLAIWSPTLSIFPGFWCRVQAFGVLGVSGSGAERAMFPDPPLQQQLPDPFASDAVMSHRSQQLRHDDAHSDTPPKPYLI